MLRLRIVSDRILGPGEGFVTTEDERNVHWFATLEEPVISINFNLRGYSQRTFFDEPDQKGGRRYILPIPESQSGDDLLARRVEREQALAFSKPMNERYTKLAPEDRDQG